MEAGWGGDVTARMTSEAAAYTSAHQPQPVPATPVSPSPTPSAAPANATAPQAPE
jgi:hypothetical protein